MCTLDVPLFWLESRLFYSLFLPNIRSVADYPNRCSRDTVASGDPGRGAHKNACARTNRTNAITNNDDTSTSFTKYPGFQFTDRLPHPWDGFATFPTLSYSTGS